MSFRKLDENQTEDQQKVNNEIEDVRCKLESDTEPSRNSKLMNDELTQVKDKPNECLVKITKVETDQKDRNYDLVTRDVLKIVSDGIGDQAENLCRMLEVEEVSLLSNKVYWEDLKYFLKEFKCFDLVEKIEKMDIITKGDFLCMETCKNYKSEINKKYTKQYKTDPIATRNGQNKKIIFKRKEIFVELDTGIWEQTYDDDGDPVYKDNMDIECFQRNSIEPEDIVLPTDDCVLVKGIAGVGKTTLLESIIFDWSDENEDPLNSFHLVIKIDCRELNVMSSIKCWRDLLQSRYPQLFTNDLSHHTGVKKVLFLIDGIDEYRYLDDFIDLLNHKDVDNSPANALYELVEPNDWLSFKKVVLLSGRPTACEKTTRVLGNMYSQVKWIGVNGFNDAGVEDLIEKNSFLDECKKSELKELFHSDKRLEVLMRIPVYAYAICTICSYTEYDDVSLLKQFNTKTKLNIALILVHIREHMLKEHKTFSEMIKDKDIMRTIEEIAKYAFISLNERRLIFEEVEFSRNKYLKSIEDSGIIVKYEDGDEGIIYQFCHLALQEMLAAIHIYCNINCKHRNTSMNTFMMYFGLLGLCDNEKISKYLSLFIQNLHTEREINNNEIDKQLIKFIMYYYYYISRASKWAGFWTYTRNIPLLFYEHDKEFGREVIHRIEDYNEPYIFLIRTRYEFNVMCNFLKFNSTKKHKHITIFSTFKLTIDNCKQLTEVIEIFMKSKNENDSSVSLEIQLELNDIQMEYISSIVPMCVKLSMYHNITSKGWDMVAKHIIQASLDQQLKLKTLEIYNNYYKQDAKIIFDDAMLEDIAPIIPMMESVKLTGFIKITPKGWKPLTQKVMEVWNEKKFKLKHLSLLDNNIDDEGMKVLAPMLPVIESVRLSDNQDITVTGWEMLIEEVKKAHQLKMKTLSASFCGIDDRSIFDPIKAMINNLWL